MQSSTYLVNKTNLAPLKTNALSQVTGVAYIGNQFFNEFAAANDELSGYRLEQFDNLDLFNTHITKSSIAEIPFAVLIETTDELQVFEDVKAIRSNALTAGTIIIILTDINKTELQQKALTAKANDIYFKPFNTDVIFERINFLIRFKLIRPHEPDKFLQKPKEYRMPVVKRLFDILVSLFIIICLSPLFLLIALIIKLESKGPIIYKSKRAGTGYKIFDFYKFRSMVVDADKKLEHLSKSHNQYAADKGDGTQSSAFVKILNDPRITRFGNILRKTSMDELPQLFNVLKGDMSIVGNRPLPLYEAEQLTSDQFAMRFLGPAGITGLWQISKRGKAEMSEEERKELDNTYAKSSSFLMDVKIMIKTIPALLQKETV